MHPPPPIADDCFLIARASGKDGSSVSDSGPPAISPNNSRCVRSSSAIGVKMLSCFVVQETHWCLAHSSLLCSPPGDGSLLWLFFRFQTFVRSFSPDSVPHHKSEAFSTGGKEVAKGRLHEPHEKHFDVSWELKSRLVSLGIKRENKCGTSFSLSVRTCDCALRKAVFGLQRHCTTHTANVVERRLTLSKKWKLQWILGPSILRFLPGLFTGTRNDPVKMNHF